MRFQCPFCRGIVSADNSELGIEVQCGHCDEVVSVPSSRLATGAVIADFIIREELGRGGMGVVYLAHQISLDRPAALKILAENYANNAEFVVNFIKEARSAAKLNHPHIVQAYAVGEDEGIFYFAMEYVDGETMKNVLKKNKIILIDQAVTVIQQIAEALDYAWKEQKLIHRDIKPDNIMLTQKGVAKLADLGLARAAEEIEEENQDEIMGTPQYISPEHLTGAPMDIRSDIYSLGATFYHFVTGRFPFEGASAVEIARKHLDEPLVPPQKINPLIPDAIGHIIEKMMKKNINDRYQNAEQLVEDLRLFRKGKFPGSGGNKVFSTRTRITSRSAVLGERDDDDDEYSLTNTASSLMPLYTATGSSTTKVNLRLSLDEEPETGNKKHKLCWTVIGLAVLIGFASFLVWHYAIPISRIPLVGRLLPQGKITPEKNMPKGSDATAPQKNYSQEMDDLLIAYGKSPDHPTVFLNNADVFLENYPDTAKDPAEINKFENFMKVYIELEEKIRIAAPREELRKKHLAEIEQRKQTGEVEKAKLAAENARKQEEEKRRAENAARSAAERSAEESRQKQAATAVKVYKNRLESRIIYIRLGLVEGGLTGNFSNAETLLRNALNERQKVAGKSPAEIKLADHFVNWATRIKAGFDKGLKVYDLYNNSGTRFAGVQMEYEGGLGKIRNIEGGIITLVLMSSDKEVKIPVKDIPRNFIYSLVKRFDKRDKEDIYFFYYLMNAHFSDKLYNEAPDDFWKNELQKIEYFYFRYTLKQATPQKVEALEQAYGDLPTFKEALKILKRK